MEYLQIAKFQIYNNSQNFIYLAQLCINFNCLNIQFRLRFVHFLPVWIRNHCYVQYCDRYQFHCLFTLSLPENPIPEWSNLAVLLLIYVNELGEGKSLASTAFLSIKKTLLHDSRTTFLFCFQRHFDIILIRRFFKHGSVVSTLGMLFQGLQNHSSFGFHSSLDQNDVQKHHVVC